LGLLPAVLIGYIVFSSEIEYNSTVQEINFEIQEIPVSNSELVVVKQDSVLAKSIRTLLNRHRPPNAFILLMDAQSGDILAWGQREDDRISEKATFLQRDSFPAASLAKIVTAAAAIENGSDPNTEFPRIGRNSTLYKRQIFPKEDYSGNTITLEEAFAKSNNPAMGIAGISLGKGKMEKTAEKLGFTNFNYPDSAYGLAESASGFTQRNSLSPLQAANAIRKLLFLQPPEEFQKSTYKGMRTLFLKTAEDGTARKDIRKSVYSHNRDSLHIGGKTGTLDGDSPPGRYDWFAGFAQSKTNPKKAVIIVVMQVHGELRNQHSTIIAGLLINEWAKNNEQWRMDNE
jgi:cell division protein FtsI/penicillin-binding protein 2